MRKTVYAVRDEKKYVGICFESLSRAKEYIKECDENFPDEKHSFERFIFVPRKCTHCGHFELMTIPENEPYSPVHYLCPQCDSTFTTSEP